MGYAIRNDKQGWRLVVDAVEVGPDEYWSDLPIEIVPRPLTQEELLRLVNAERDQLLMLAAIRIAPLQDAADLDVATVSDAENLKLWKQYRIAVNRVGQQPGYPEIIEWPPQPA
ncbi:tail fiber assembly protein [Pseudomonas sp. CHM02]|uniref:tail fiber assembly protein n=1 Tax=Pseudomonas sp. CHM02 TaxID=1463662 RepID=UPI00047201D0|nr:tail fiber assembly protein [Pseudomonas sp. CHM02]